MNGEKQWACVTLKITNKKSDNVEAKNGAPQYHFPAVTTRFRLLLKNRLPDFPRFSNVSSTLLFRLKNENASISITTLDLTNDINSSST